MFRPDITELKSFYEGHLGHQAGVIINSEIRKMWREQFETTARTDEMVLGLGYAGPYMKMFIPRSQRSLLAMPSQQGVCRWPENSAKAGNLAFLTEESELPLPDMSADRIIMCHALEYSTDPYAMMREVWRLLKPEGRMIVVVPNRQGMWAWTDRTPFGHGRPFSHIQLDKLLNENLFSVLNIRSCLFAPPISNKLIIKTSRFCEGVGRLALNPFGGLLIANAEKRMYADRAILATEQSKESLIYGKAAN